MESDFQAINDEITAAVKHLRLTTLDVQALAPSEANAIVDRAMRKFVIGNPRSWWLSLAVQHETLTEPVRHELNGLRALVPTSVERCYFVPETGTSAYMVFDAKIDCLGGILNECQFFEYYVIDRDYQWLLIETDHNTIVKALSS